MSERNFFRALEELHECRRDILAAREHVAIAKALVQNQASRQEIEKWSVVADQLIEAAEGSLQRSRAALNGGKGA